MTSPRDWTQNQAFMVLNAVPGMGPATLKHLLPLFGGDPRRLLAAPHKRIEAIKALRPAMAAALLAGRASFDLERENRRMAESGTRFVSIRDPDFPQLLLEIPNPPIGFYQRGASLEGPWVALVGTRKASPYGLALARRLAGELARKGVGIISGLARGIDAAAHEGALESGGRTAAVLGQGMDLLYPPENRALQGRIEREGTLLSEYPFGCRGSRRSFALRNRIISGLCQTVVVVESGFEGGAQITARFALSQGRCLFAVPGRIGDPESEGCLQLIRDGAEIFTGIGDILKSLGSRRGIAPAQIH